LLHASIPATIDIRSNLATEDYRIFGDLTHIHQVVMNLGTNAAYAMRESGGILAVNLKKVDIDPEQAEAAQVEPGPYVQLTVSDNGPGIPQSVLAQVFDPFFTTKPKEEGTGLGLSVVHGIVADHKGMITADSRPGHGTIFHVYFPQLACTNDEPQDSDIPLPEGSERILVIDDEPAIAATHKAFLESLGYSVTTLTDSEEAIACFSNDPTAVDLIITDQTMPRLTGDKLTLKVQEIRPKMPVILCTGFSHVIDESRSKTLGIREFLYKPVLRKDLAHAVRRALDDEKG
jgi:CheY-like chemotaxis protein